MAEGADAGPGTVLAPVHLVALGPSGTRRVAELRAAVVRLRPAPGQRRFSGAAEQTLPQADQDPHRIPFAVLWDGSGAPPGGIPVGFGVLDSGSARDALADAPWETVLLRAFYLEPQWQGHGIGRAVCVALDELVPDVAPWARWVVLTVNEDNEPAIRAYRAGGFHDTGRRHVGAASRPQLVLARPVTAR